MNICGGGGREKTVKNALQQKNAWYVPERSVWLGAE